MNDATIMFFEAVVWCALAPSPAKRARKTPCPRKDSMRTKRRLND